MGEKVIPGEERGIGLCIEGVTLEPFSSEQERTETRRVFSIIKLENVRPLLPFSFNFSSSRWCRDD